MKSTLIATLLTIAIAGSAHAIEYSQVQAAQSQITFDYQQMGVSMKGNFNKFTSQLRFNPAEPAAAKGSIEVALSSVDTGSDEGNAEVATKTWFNTKGFPTARFEITRVTPRGGDRYDVTGKLTIKGTAREVLVPATFTPQGKTGVFEGRLTIKRGDFSIGEGPWKTFDIVANDVLIKFSITAVAGK